MIHPARFTSAIVALGLASHLEALVMAQTSRPAAAASRPATQGWKADDRTAIQAGDYRVTFSAGEAWAIDDIYFRESLFATVGGFHGLVLTPAGGDWIGSGHTEGGREQVRTIQVIRDGRALAPAEFIGQTVGVCLRSPGRRSARECATAVPAVAAAHHGSQSRGTPRVGETVTGRQVVFEKESMIRQLAVRQTVTVTPDGITEKTDIHAVEDESIKIMYAFMHCLPPTSTQYIGEASDGTFYQGRFASKGGMKLVKNVRWTASYFPDKSVAALIFYPTPMPDPASYTQYWDLEGYHKCYSVAHENVKLRKGDRESYCLEFRVIPVAGDEWVEKCRQVASALKAKHPQTQSTGGS